MFFVICYFTTRYTSPTLLYQNINNEFKFTVVKAAAAFLQKAKRRKTPHFVTNHVKLTQTTTCCSEERS